MSKTLRLGWLAALFLAFTHVPAFALTLSTSALTMSPGATATVTLSNIYGTVSLSNSNTAVVSASLASNIIKVTAKTVGSATLSVKDRSGTKTLAVTVKPPMSVSPTSISLPSGQTATITVSNASGSIGIKNSDESKISTTLTGNTITVTGKEVGEAKVTVYDTRTQVEVPVTVTSGTPPPPSAAAPPGASWPATASSATAPTAAAASTRSPANPPRNCSPSCASSPAAARAMESWPPTPRASPTPRCRPSPTIWPLNKRRNNKWIAVHS